MFFLVLPGDFMANSLCSSEQRTRGNAGSLLSRRSGAVGRVALKLGTRFQGKGEEDLEATLEPWGLGLCDAFLEGLMDGFLDGFGDNDLVLPRLDDLERALFTVFALSLTFFKEDVSVSSQALLKLS